MKSGNPITFDNVKGIWLNGALQDYYLLDMGMLWATGTVTFRNFEVKTRPGRSCIPGRRTRTSRE